MVDITFKINDVEVRKKLKKLNRKSGSLKEPLTEVGDDLLQFYGKDVFEFKGKKLGETWKSLSPATLKLRRERRLHYANAPAATNKILIWTGNLRDGFIKKVTRTTLTIKNTVSYFKFHQLGTRKAGRRRMLGINKEVITRVVKKLDKYYNDLIK